MRTLIQRNTQKKILLKNTKNKTKPMRMARDPHTSKLTHSKHGKDTSLSAVTKLSNEKQTKNHKETNQTK